MLARRAKRRRIRQRQTETLNEQQSEQIPDPTVSQRDTRTRQAPRSSTAQQYRAAAGIKEEKNDCAATDKRHAELIAAAQDKLAEVWQLVKGKLICTRCEKSGKSVPLRNKGKNGNPGPAGIVHHSVHPCEQCKKPSQRLLAAIQEQQERLPELKAAADRTAEIERNLVTARSAIRTPSTPPTPSIPSFTFQKSARNPTPPAATARDVELFFGTPQPRSATPEVPAPNPPTQNSTGPEGMSVSLKEWREFTDKVMRDQAEAFQQLTRMAKKLEEAHAKELLMLKENYELKLALAAEKMKQSEDAARRAEKALEDVQRAPPPQVQQRQQQQQQWGGSSSSSSMAGSSSSSRAGSSRAGSSSRGGSARRGQRSPRSRRWGT